MTKVNAISRRISLLTDTGVKTNRIFRFLNFLQEALSLHLSLSEATIANQKGASSSSNNSENKNKKNQKGWKRYQGEISGFDGLVFSLKGECETNTVIRKVMSKLRVFVATHHLESSQLLSTLFDDPPTNPNVAFPTGPTGAARTDDIPPEQKCKIPRL